VAKTLLRNLAFCVCLLAAYHLAVSTSVHANSGSCWSQRGSCRQYAQVNYDTCANGCAIGDTNCTNACQATQTNANAVCDNQYQQCITIEGNDCTSAQGPCPGSGNIAICSFNGSDESCNCYCECGTNPPSCPGGPAAAGCTSSGWVCNSPILIDTSGEGIALTSAQEVTCLDFLSQSSLRISVLRQTR
jgi:hypothetical protein